MQNSGTLLVVDGRQASLRSLHAESDLPFEIIIRGDAYKGRDNVVGGGFFRSTVGSLVLALRLPPDQHLIEARAQCLDLELLPC